MNWVESWANEGREASRNRRYLSLVLRDDSRETRRKREEYSYWVELEKDRRVGMRS